MIWYIFGGQTLWVASVMCWSWCSHPCVTPALECGQDLWLYGKGYMPILCDDVIGLCKTSVANVPSSPSSLLVVRKARGHDKGWQCPVEAWGSQQKADALSPSCKEMNDTNHHMDGEMDLFPVQPPDESSCPSTPNPQKLWHNVCCFKRLGLWHLLCNHKNEYYWYSALA